MAILIQPIGKIDNNVILMLEKSLGDIFDTDVFLSNKRLEIPEESYNPARKQFNSTKILSFMIDFIKEAFDHVLGVTDVDLYVPGLHFVFGQAQCPCPGTFAIISVHRLQHPDEAVFLDRIVKEAVHELGHIYGLTHCDNPLCVMHFSNSLMDTDIKGKTFCEKCLNRIRR
ncbi:MAG: archaemetzincin family Zn-dependent metalloprotease [Halobacteriota archaeon]